MTEKLFVLTVQTDENDVYTHLFRSFDNAVKCVLDGIRYDFENNLTSGYVDDEGKIDDDGEAYISKVKEILEKKCWWVDGDNTKYDIEEREIEG